MCTVSFWTCKLLNLTGYLFNLNLQFQIIWSLWSQWKLSEHNTDILSAFQLIWETIVCKQLAVSTSSRYGATMAFITIHVCVKLIDAAYVLHSTNSNGNKRQAL